jgi:bile acid:Na+ symporter, BASS family
MNANWCKRLLRDRNFIMLIGIGVGLAWGGGAKWTEPLTLPGLAVVMTLSTMGISGSTFRPISSILSPAFAGIVMTYLVFAGTILPLNLLFVKDPALRTGFILLAAVPPAIAVIPFTLFLRGNTAFSLIGTIGAYLGGLALMPAITLLFIGADLLNPFKVVLILVELMVAPLIAGQVLMWARLERFLTPVKGTIINWSFCVFTYTVVGLNREIFLHNPASLISVAVIATLSMFLLGWGIERVARFMKLSDEVTTSLVLLGTLKNYGIAGGIALTLFSKEAAMPSTVSAVIMILYIIWLEYKTRWRTAAAG